MWRPVVFFFTSFHTIEMGLVEKHHRTLTFRCTIFCLYLIVILLFSLEESSLQAENMLRQPPGVYYLHTTIPAALITSQSWNFQTCKICSRYI